MNSVADVQLGEDAVHMRLHRGGGEVERLADLTVGEPGDHAREHLELARAERVERIARVVVHGARRALWVQMRASGGVVVYQLLRDPGLDHGLARMNRCWSGGV